MKCYRSLPALCPTAGQTSTGHLTNWSTLEKDTTYVDCPSPFSSTPLVWRTHIPCWIDMCCFRDYCETATLHSAQLIRKIFHSWNVAPSPVAQRLYAWSPHFPEMNPGVQEMVLVFSRFVYNPILQNIATVTEIASLTHRWELLVLYYHEIMLIYPYPFLVVITQFFLNNIYSWLFMYTNWFAWIISIYDCICYTWNWG